MKLKYKDPNTGEFVSSSVPLKVVQQITVNGGGSFNAPAYVIEEAERVSSGFNSKTSDDMFKFVAISDMHEMGDSDHSSQDIIDRYRRANLNAGQGAKIVAEKVKADCAVNFGDFAWWSGSTTKYDGVWSIVSARCKTYLDNVSENFYTPGNHDAYLSDHDVLTGMTGDYRYKDFTEKKIRVIVLNTADNGTGNNREYISGAQLQWFCEALDLSGKSDVAQWGIIVCSHHPADWSATLMPIANILAAYEKGTSYSVSRDSVNVSYNFAGKNIAKVLAQFHGHVHCFKVADIAGTSIKRIAIPNACFGRNNEYTNLPDFSETSTYNKTDNSGKNTAFCVVGIDRQKGRIFADCYGAGYDRIIAIEGGEVVTYTVSNSLTYAKTNNGSSVVAQGGSYSATITAKKGYTLEGAAVSVKMGGAVITSTAYANGTISIAEVTGDIVISVVAVVDQNAEVTKYTVANNLTDVSSSNASAEIEEGAEYGAVLSVGSRYQMQNVVVIMGGKDITATAYKGSLYGGDINIENVTGNIVITATAFVPNYTNLVPTARATYNGTAIYNGKGYKNGAYVSDNGSFGTDANTVAVGYLTQVPTDVIYIKGAELTTASHVRIYTDSMSGNAVIYCVGSGLNLSTGVWNNSIGEACYNVEVLGDKYYKLTPTSRFGETLYFRVSLVGTGENLIITINEPIE